ncbi:universal stress protein [Halanaeroarchaeum sp. HSR-CO]|uniref:universal stress protein n=1 Tax=Halanaeroarchaeum sp. HSR-CO TaxID=2866382 RepID=UPI00217D3549|nr:universal stress protein [Halanaeroarchaeum sp. HSR-CO]
MTLAVDTVLVPVDGSEAAADAAEYAVAIAERYDADLHVLYVLGETVARGMEAGDIDRTDVADESQLFVEDVAAMAEDPTRVESSMAYGFSTVRKTRHPGSVVLDTAEELSVDFIVIPRESLAGEHGDALEKAAEYVLLYASQPVLSV